MKQDKNELMRVQTLIEKDRINTKDDFFELVVSDTDKLLKDYFDYKDLPKIAVSKVGNRYKIELSILVDRVKNFTTIPK